MKTAGLVYDGHPPDPEVPLQQARKGFRFVCEKPHRRINCLEGWHTATASGDEFGNWSDAQEVNEKSQAWYPNNSPRLVSLLTALLFELFAHAGSLRLWTGLSQRKGRKGFNHGWARMCTDGLLQRSSLRRLMSAATRIKK